MTLPSAEVSSVPPVVGGGALVTGGGAGGLVAADATRVGVCVGVCADADTGAVGVGIGVVEWRARADGGAATSAATGPPTTC